MPILGVSEDTIVNTIGIIIIPLLAIVIGYIRKLEKKVDKSTECNEANTTAIGKLEQQIAKHETNVKEMFSEHKLEAKDDKTNLIILMNTVTSLTEKVTEAQGINNEFRSDIRDLEQKIVASHDKLMAFFTDWLQRIEDTKVSKP